jgi:hypothetical protein
MVIQKLVQHKSVLPNKVLTGRRGLLSANALWLGGPRPGRDALHARDGRYDEEANADRVGYHHADPKEVDRSVIICKTKSPVEHHGRFFVKTMASFRLKSLMYKLTVAHISEAWN